MFRKICMAVLVVALCATLTGCFEIEEKVSIQPEGTVSSLLKLRLYLPKGAKQEKTNQLNISEEGIGKGIEGFESAAVTTREVMGQLISEISLKAQSWKALAAAYDTLPKDKESAQNDPSMRFDQLFTQKGFWQIKNKGKTILFTRTFLPAPKKKETKPKKDDEGMGDLVSMMMGSMAFRMELDLPGDVVSSNAEEQDGRQLRWVIPLDWLSTHKVVLQAEIKSTPELVKALF